MISLDTHTLVESYLDWWGDIGLAAPASDQQVSWLAPPAAPVVSAPPSDAQPAQRMEQPQRPAPQAVAEAAPQKAQKFNALSEFDAWAATPGNLPFAHWSPRPALPFGPADAPIMLIGDFPEEHDCREGRLFSGEQGSLLEAMLKAIDLDLLAQRCAAISLSRPPSPRFDSATLQVLRPLLDHQIALVRPKVLLILGARSAGALTGRAVVPDPDSQPDFNHLTSNITPYITYHPRELIARPQLKRHAWEVLKRLRTQL